METATALAVLEPRQEGAGCTCELRTVTNGLLASPGERGVETGEGVSYPYTLRGVVLALGAGGYRRPPGRKSNNQLGAVEVSSGAWQGGWVLKLNLSIPSL